jgi:hypothetical protein
LLSLHPEDGGSKILRNVCIIPHQYTASQLRRPRFEYVNTRPNEELLTVTACSMPQRKVIVEIEYAMQFADSRFDSYLGHIYLLLTVGRFSDDNINLV